MRCLFDKISDPAAIIANRTSKYGANTDTPIYCAISPNSGGIIIIPVFAAAICTPTTDCDTSAPKFFGVRCIMFGNIGALPSPIKNSIAAAAAGGIGKISAAAPVKVII